MKKNHRNKQRSFRENLEEDFDLGIWILPVVHQKYQKNDIDKEN